MSGTPAGDSSTGRGAGDSALFADCIDRMAAKGAAMLVTGTVSDGALRSFVAEMFGEPHLDRRCVLVLSESHDARDYLPGRLTPDSELVEAVDGTHLRSTAAAGAGDDRALGVRLASIRKRIDEAVEALRPPGGYDPGQLRVGLVSLPSLLPMDAPADQHRQLVRWLDHLAGRVPGSPERGRLVAYAPVGNHSVDRLLEAPIGWDCHVRLRQDHDAVGTTWRFPVDRYPDLLDEETHGRMFEVDPTG